LRFRALASRACRSSALVFFDVIQVFSEMRGCPSSDGVAQASLMWHVSARLTHKVRCRSSVVEHSLGKGEVGSSILPGSTIHPFEIIKCRCRRAIQVQCDVTSHATPLEALECALERDDALPDGEPKVAALRSTDNRLDGSHMGSAWEMGSVKIDVI